MMKYHDYHHEAYTVADKGRRIVLNLVYDNPDRERVESHIEFRGVVLYHFVHTGGAVFTDIGESDLDDALAEYGPAIQEWARLYGPTGRRSDLREYAKWLAQGHMKAWRIESAIGFYGVVIGESVE
jgi:hypothetical protein